jgi:hypothetical protein
VVVDGHAGAEYDLLGDGTPIFSPDGKHVAYVAWRGAKELVVVDGQPGAECERVGGLIFSLDGKRVAYGAKKAGKCFVVVDGQPGAECEGVRGLIFSLDGKRVAYAAAKGWWKRKWFVVVDGQPGPPYDELGENGPTFDSDGVLEYLAFKDNSLWRVKHIPVR